MDSMETKHSEVGQANFFTCRWHGSVDLPLLFWRDMLGVGTLINALATFAALIAASQSVDVGAAAALHFAPLPYNLFLVMSVWRSSQTTPLRRAGALAWLLAMTFL